MDSSSSSLTQDGSLGQKGEWKPIFRANSWSQQLSLKSPILEILCRGNAWKAFKIGFPSLLAQTPLWSLGYFIPKFLANLLVMINPSGSYERGSRVLIMTTEVLFVSEYT